MLFKNGFLLVILSGFCFARIAAAESIDLQLRWHHQFQFAGYYAAEAKGFYRKVGLNVTLHSGSPGRLPVDEVLQGHAQFGVANSELLLERLKGRPFVALAAVFQHSPSVLLARKDANIYFPNNLVGKKIMMLDRSIDADFVAMFKNEGIDIKSIEIIPSSYNIQDLVDGKIAAFNSYVSNEPYLLKQQGIEYAVLNPRNYGVDFYSDILFTTEDYLAKHPDQVEAFRNASMEGWSYALEHPDEIIQIILKQYHAQKAQEHLEFEAEAMRSLIMPDLVELGHMNPWRWQHMAETFVNAGMVKDYHKLNGFMYDYYRTDNSEILGFARIALAVAIFTSFVAVVLYFAFQSVKREIRLRVEAEAEIKKLAYFDTLTGLNNRHHFFLLTEQMMKVAHREQHKFAVLFLDLNDFKSINDHMGHQVGDAVLAHVAHSLGNFIRQSDISARLGGDEFVVLLGHISSKDDVVRALQQLQQAISQTFIYQGHELVISASIGMAVYPDDGNTIDALLDVADSHMYRVKSGFKQERAVLKEVNGLAFEGKSD